MLEKFQTGRVDVGAEEEVFGSTNITWHSVNYRMIESNLTVCAAIQQDDGGCNG